MNVNQILIIGAASQTTGKQTIQPIREEIDRLPNFKQNLPIMNQTKAKRINCDKPNTYIFGAYVKTRKINTIQREWCEKDENHKNAKMNAATE